jgi:hypothetical protein
VGLYFAGAAQYASPVPAFLHVIDSTQFMPGLHMYNAVHGACLLRPQAAEYADGRGLSRQVTRLADTQFFPKSEGARAEVCDSLITQPDSRIPLRRK